VNRQGGGRVVVEDRPRPRPGGDRRVCRGRQVDGERLVRLERRVAVDGDGERLGGHPGGDGEQRRGDRDVVAGGGRGAGVGRRGEGEGLPADRREGDGEGRRGGAAVPLDHADAVDAQGRDRVVVGDRARPGRRRVARVGRPTDVQRERLVRLVLGVAV